MALLRCYWSGLERGKRPHEASLLAVRIGDFSSK